MGETEGADLLASSLVTCTELLRGAKRCLSMLSQELQKVLSPQKIHLARLKGFGGSLVRLAGYDRVQAQNFARLNDPQSNCLPVALGHGELHAPLTDHEHSTGSFLLDEQNCPSRVSGCVTDAIKHVQRALRELAEKPFRPQRAILTALAQFKAVGRMHRCPPSFALIAFHSIRA